MVVLDTAVDKFWGDVYFHAEWKRSRETNHCVCVVVAEYDRVKSTNAIMKRTVVVRGTVNLVVERNNNMQWECLVNGDSQRVSENK